MPGPGRIVGLVVVAMVAGGIVAGHTRGQDSARAALIGAWSGTITQERTGSVTTGLEFADRDGVLVWRWGWESEFGIGAAEGTVTRYDPPAVELSGRYTLHPFPAIENSPITMSLTLSGAALHGTGLTTAVNRPFRISVTKK